MAAFDLSYWAWQRDEPPSDTERAQLTAQGVRTIYWEIGELENHGAIWTWKAHFELPASDATALRFVPVVRLESRERNPFAQRSVESLIAALAGAINGKDELQLDYDAPDRLIADYAGVLKKIHALVPKLGITALPHWIRNGAVHEFPGSVDELVPMLYDFEPDPVVEGGSPLPLIEPEKSGRWISDWGRCPIPWRAGVPAFARATVLDPTGKSRGHIREWSWDDICFHRALGTTGSTQLGVTLLRATKATTVGNGTMQKSQLLAARWPDRFQLSRMLAAAEKAGARGAVFFRFPDSTDPSGWSLAQLARLDATTHLALRQPSQTRELELQNDSAADLEPRLSGGDGSGERDRGYALEIEASAPIFRDASEGDFWRIVGHAEGAPRAVAVPLATRLTFWFSHLRAGQTLRTGPIQLAPGETLLHTRFRILNFAGNSEWKNFEASNLSP